MVYTTLARWGVSGKERREAKRERKSFRGSTPQPLKAVQVRILPSSHKPIKTMHYRIKTNIQYAKTACARNVPKSEATTSRMSVTCETCLRYIQEKGGSRG